jgi:hypothetical protein
MAAPNMRERLLATLDRRFFRFMSVMAALNYINEILTKGWFLSLASGMLLLVLLSYWDEQRSSSRVWRSVRIIACCVYAAMVFYSLAQGYLDGSSGSPRREDLL